MKAVGKLLILCIILFLALILSYPIIPSRAETTVIFLGNHSMIRAPVYGSLSNVYVFGEVQNVGDVPVNLTRVTVTFLDGQGFPIDSISRYTKLNVILPGKTAPFEIAIQDSDERIVDYSFSELTFVATTAKPIKLELLSCNSYLDSGGWMHVGGTVKNIADRNATYVKLIATFYNTTNGKVIGVATDYANEIELEANQTSGFDIQVSGVKVPATASSVVVAESLEFLSEMHSTVLVDRTPPDIVLVAWNPQTPNSTQQVKVNATVVEPSYASGVKNVTLWYKVNDAPFQSISMQKQNEQWTAVIAPQNEGVTVQFFIEAFDKEQNKAVHPSPPYYYTVVNKSTAPPFSPEISIALLVIIVIVAGVLIKYRKKLF